MSALSQAAQGNSPRRTRRTIRRAVTTLILCALPPATYEGAQQVGEHYLSGSTPSGVSYETPDRVAAMLEHAKHSPATKGGSFIDHAELTGTGKVVGVKAVS